MPETFDWNNLGAFLAVARTGRLTAAAARLGADHTTVARRITALEQGLKARLFHRSPSGYTLTPQGERLLPTAERIESLALAAQSQVGGSEAAISGAVRIGAPEGFGSYFLAPRMGALCEAHPELEVQLVAIPGVFSLSKREADLAIALSPPREGRLVARKLTDYSLGLYASPDYLEGHAEVASAADLKGCRAIGYIEDLLYAPELDYLDQTSVELSLRFKSSNLIAQLRAALAGVGVCILPDFIAAAEPGLRPILREQVRLERSFWLVSHADLKGVARIRTTADFIVEQVRAARALFLPWD